MLSVFISYRNLILHSVFSFSLYFLLTALNVCPFFFHGLYTYILPENLPSDRRQPSSSSLRAAIRRPEAEDHRRPRSKDGPDFDESTAQIFRLRLADGHLESRLHFPLFRSAFVSFVIAIFDLLLHFVLPRSDEDSGVFLNGSAIPIVLGFQAIGRGVFCLARVTFDSSASRFSEKQMCALMGLLGFLSALLIIFTLSPSFFDFDFGSGGNEFTKLMTTASAGCIAGFLYMPSIKIARSFWLGTDQLRWNLSVVSSDAFGRFLLYSNLLMLVFASLLWINPMAEILIEKHEDRGLDRADLLKLRVWSLAVSGILQILSLRTNLQMFLNEALLSWYQRLHSSKVPDLDFSRAKIFLHNHYLCLVVLQLFVPPAMVLVFLGLSQIQGNFFSDFPLIDRFEHSSSLVKEIFLLMSWWIAFVSIVFASMNLALYRCGILMIS